MSIRFSIIIVDYDQSVDRGYMRRAIRSVMNQNIDFNAIEILLFHITEQRFNNWGHSLRNMGIQQAKGEYIVHLNADNILYPNALERLSYHADKAYPPIYDAAGNIKNNNDILIFCLSMKGVVFCNGGFSRRPGEEDSYAVILTGIPTKFRNIDCMQLVMKRENWLKENGWHDLSRNSDGNMYPEFVKKYGARYIAEILGEHW